MLFDTQAASAAIALLFGSWGPWLVVIPGLIIGLIGGALPGISGSMTLALVLPFTVYMDFLSALLLLTSIFTGASFGGAVPAILINLPGETAAVSTAFDGFPMSRKGQHNEALGLGLAASTFGEMISYLFLMLVINWISGVVLRLGPFEMFMVALWGITMIAALRGNFMERGLFIGAVGLVLGTVGMGPTGVLRGTFGISWLFDGIPTVPAMIGLLATGELFNLARTPYIVEDKALRTLSFRRIWAGFMMVFRYPGVLIRGSLIGVIIGVVPGVGASVANLISYADAKRAAPDRDTFGQGNPKGVVAGEAANASSEGGSMATLLALGIPGGNATAVMLAAFALHNIAGGPRFINDHKDIVYALIFGNFVQALLLVVVGLFFIRFIVMVVKMPVRVLIPTVLVLAVIGTYAFTGSMVGPVTLAASSVVGWLIARYQFSAPAAVVGLLLGEIVEAELVHAHQISGGDFTFIFGRPVALGLAAMIILSIAWQPVKELLRRRIQTR